MPSLWLSCTKWQADLSLSLVISEDTFLAGKKLRPPSLADEAVLLKYYKGRAQEICSAFGFLAPRLCLSLIVSRHIFSCRQEAQAAIPGR